MGSSQSVPAHKPGTDDAAASRDDDVAVPSEHAGDEKASTAPSSVPDIDDADPARGAPPLVYTDDDGDATATAPAQPPPHPPSHRRSSSGSGRRSSWLPSFTRRLSTGRGGRRPPPTQLSASPGDGLSPATDAAVKAALVAGRGTGIVNLAGLDLPALPQRVIDHLPRRLTIVSLAHNPRLGRLGEEDPVVLMGPSGSPPPQAGGKKGAPGGGGKPDAPGGHLRRVLLTDCGLTTLPATISVWSQLRSLDVADNRLSALPDVFAAFPHLESLTASGNALTDLPASLASCGRLLTLDVSRNALGPSLPMVVCDMRSVVTLRVAANGLTALPETLVGAAALEVLDVADNALPAVPPVVLRCCTRLVVVELAGNPAAATADAHADGWGWLAERAAAESAKTSLYRLEAVG